MHSKITKFVVALSLAFCVGGCGFKLAGTRELPPQLLKVHVRSARPYSSLSVAVKNEFIANSAQIVNDKHAKVTLNIIKSTFTHDDMNIVSSTQATIYHFNYSVTFDLLDSHGKNIIAPQTVSSARTITFNPNEVIDASNETRVVEAEMRNDVIFKMFLILNANNTRKALAAVDHKQSTHSSKH